MIDTAKKHRIIFIDLMRAFAVFQMVQGHTIDTLLADSYRDQANPFFAVWFFMRGMTAPIFMFTAGTVFTYLFRLVKEPFKNNPRVRKGIKRGLLLICLGYLLRYPTWKVFDFSNVPDSSWNTFMVVDVLQLIGFGLFSILLILYLTEKFKLNDYIAFSIVALIVFLVSPIFFRIEWNDFLPRALAGYFYNGTGSLFPYFPWAGYVIGGGVLGSYLAKHPNVFRSLKFSIWLLSVGVSFMILSIIVVFAADSFGVNIGNNSATTSLIFFRIGFVLMLNAIVSYISLKANSIPKLIILIGRNTLMIYVVHLLILYGSAWNPGLYKTLARSFDGWQAIISALVMFTTMTLMVLLFNIFKIRNKQLVT